MSEKLPRSREVVSRSWSIVSKHWRVLAKYLAPLLIVTIAADILLFRPEPGALALIIMLILIVYSVWMTIVLMRLVDQAARGRALDEAAARKNVPERILPWLGVSIVTGLVTLGGFALFIIPGIVLSMMYFAAPYKVLLDNEHVHEAIYHSVELTKGRKANLFWTLVWATVIILLVYLLVGAVVGSIVYGIGLAFSDLTYQVAWSTVGSNVAEIVTMPLFTGISIVLYRALHDSRRLAS